MMSNITGEEGTSFSLIVWNILQPNDAIATLTWNLATL